MPTRPSKECVALLAVSVRSMISHFGGQSQLSSNVSNVLASQHRNAGSHFRVRTAERGIKPFLYAATFVCYVCVKAIIEAEYEV